jgi:hypothetical protein
MLPEVMFIEHAVIPRRGERTVNLLLVREADGRYRRATGQDLTALYESFPNFVKAINRPQG